MTDPKIAGRQPVPVDVEAGESKAWCACGHSAGQPFCDGSHRGTGMAPVPFTSEESKKVFLCMCKHTKNPPFCDGTHASLTD